MIREVGRDGRKHHGFGRIDAKVSAVRLIPDGLVACVMYRAGDSTVVSAVLDPDVSVICDEGLAAVGVQLARAGAPVAAAGLAKMRARAFADLSRAAEVEELSRPALEALNAAGIRFVVIKGPVTRAHTGELALRSFVDVDILVSREEFVRAMALLRRCGFTEPVSTVPPWPLFQRACREGVNLIGRSGGVLDLHHHIGPWVFGRELGFEELWARSVNGIVAGTSVRVASATDTVVLTALHVLSDLYKGSVSARSLRDLALLRRSLDTRDVCDAFARADISWLYELMEAVLLHLAGDKRSAPMWVAVPPASAIRLRALGWEGPTKWSRHPVGWAWRLGMARASIFLLGSVVPSPMYLRAKDLSYREYWMLLIRSLGSPEAVKTEMRRRARGT